jgi:hypothetical protein
MVFYDINRAFVYEGFGRENFEVKFIEQEKDFAFVT